MNYIHTVERQQLVRRVITLKGEALPVSFDFSVWQDEIGQTISSVSWVLEYGQASISNEALSSNVASALITTSNAGNSLIKITATTSAGTAVEYLELRTQDNQSIVDDYGYLYG